MNAIQAAKKFHEIYERLAPEYGYETRPETRAFDLASKNGRLMVATVSEFLTTAETAAKERIAELERQCERYANVLDDAINRTDGIIAMLKIEEGIGQSALQAAREENK